MAAGAPTATSGICGAKRRLITDAIVYATAVSQGADLLTCDAHFAGLKEVVLFSKTIA